MLTRSDEPDALTVATTRRGAFERIEVCSSDWGALQAVPQAGAPAQPVATSRLGRLVLWLQSLAR